MCIAFFESHPENQHQHYALHYHCAYEGCDGLFESHHRFLLESACGDCSHCLQHDGVEVAPDVNPVTYYPPIYDSRTRFVPSRSWEQVGKKVNVSTSYKGLATGENREESNKHEHSDSKRLSDVDSVTYHWRKGGVGALPKSQYQPQQPSPVPKFPTKAKSKDVSHPSSAFRGPHNQHQDVHQPFAGQVPSVQSSPNTTMHRDLVNEQLARLPHHIAHAQQQFQSIHWHSLQNHGKVQRKSHHWGGPQGYATRTSLDLWQSPRPG